MDLFSRFKKDYFNYLLSVILPALIMGLSIPVLKHLLGAKGYGEFSIWFNAVLICAASLTGWIMQSILRFYNSSANKMVFVKQTFSIFYYAQLIIFFPVLLIVWYIKMDLIFAILFFAAFFLVSMLFSVMALSQSGFLSRKNISSETIRVVSYMGIGLLLLKFTGIPYLYALFFAVIISYTLTVAYLRNQIRLSFVGEKSDIISENAKHLGKRFLRYGAPLSVWFALTYMTSYVDKLFMVKNLGSESQGNYQAIFDLLSRSLALIISPVTISLFPILTLAYKKGEVGELKKLIRKIILYEFAGFLLVTILYWLFGANLLLYILKVPKSGNYVLAGFLTIVGTFIWQIAMVAQKRFELGLQSLLLLLLVAIAFITQVVLYIVFQKHSNILLYPAGYVLSGLVYLMLLFLFSSKIKEHVKSQHTTIEN
ncbi:MAG: hypothetical protein ABJA78_03595 [Ferruginibacter sp.]